MNVESLKEYLVKIGWKTDDASLSKAESKIGGFGKKVASHAKSLGNAFLTASKVSGEFAIGLAKDFVNITKQVANADLQTEQFARKMWISEQSARSLQTSLDALGMSYEDLFFATEEQYNQFLQLNALGKTLEAPAAFDETLKEIRGIQFEFSKFQQMFQYFYRWVGYYIGQKFGKDIKNIRKFAADINSFFQKNLSKIAERVSRWISNGIQLAKDLYYLAKGILSVLYNMFETIGTDGVKSIGLLGASFLAITKGPLGMMLAGLALLILLMDDYFTWKKGGTSFFGDEWEKLDEILEKINSKDGSESGFVKLADSIGNVIDLLGEFAEKVFGIKSPVDFITTLFEGLNTVLGVTADILNFIVMFINGLKPSNWGDHWLDDWAESTELYKWLMGTDNDKSKGEIRGGGFGTGGSFGGSFGGTTNNDNSSKTITYETTINNYGNTDANGVADAFENRILRNAAWR